MLCFLRIRGAMFQNGVWGKKTRPTPFFSRNFVSYSPRGNSVVDVLYHPSQLSVFRTRIYLLRAATPSLMESLSKQLRRSLAKRTINRCTDPIESLCS